MSQAEIGLIGLGVMGSNLALNIAENGHSVAVYNRNPDGRISSSRPPDHFSPRSSRAGPGKSWSPQSDRRGR